MKPAMSILRHRTCAGFSLIEMVVSITVLAILSASAAIFLRGPINSYFDAERRANLADAGSLAMAKMSREISRAVPNSVRVRTISATEFYLEFLPVVSEGRYRSGGAGNVLTLGAPDTGFDALCAAPAVPCPAPGNWVVVNNHLPGASVWTGSSRAGPVIVAGSTVSYPSDTFATPVPATAAPDRRFQITGQPVTYACRGGQLRRYSGYAIQALQPANAVGAPLVGAPGNDLLAVDVTTCQATVLAGNLRRAQVVALAFGLTNTGDSLNLAHTIRVEPLP